MESLVIATRSYKYLDNLGFEVSYKPENGYKIEYSYIPTNSVKEVTLYKINANEEKEIDRFSNLDNILDVVKLLEKYPQKIVENILQTLK
jgi:hypothetical protein